MTKSNALEHSYGIIPLRKHRGAWRVLLVQHGTSGYWGFPKGHAEEGESPREAALRELFEETHLEVVRFLSESILEEHYSFYRQSQQVDKTVFYLIAEVRGSIKLQKAEIRSSRWIPLLEATHALTYETDKNICLHVIHILLQKE